MDIDQVKEGGIDPRMQRQLWENKEQYFYNTLPFPSK